MFLYSLWHTNHRVDSCFKKHGFPPHWKQDGTINNYAATTEKEEESQVKFHEENEQDHGNLVFTPDQHKALLALLQGASSLQNHNINHLKTQLDIGLGIICIILNTHRPENFILDTDATNHVCYTRKFFQCMKTIKPITI